MCCSPIHNKHNKHGSLRKSVSFDDDAEIHPVIKPLSKLKGKEKRVLWYDTDEFIAFQSAAKRTVRAIRAGASQSIDCSRGFENLRSKTFQKMTESQKDTAIKSVLSAQKDGASATELAALCMRHTEEARVRALVLAAKDATDVLETSEVVKVESEHKAEPMSKKRGQVLQLLGLNAGAKRPSKKRVFVGRPV